MKVNPTLDGGDYNFELNLMYEFHNPHFDNAIDKKESMMIWLKKFKQYLTEDVTAESDLILIDTVVQDYILYLCYTNKWKDISTTTRYTDEADSIVNAVITSKSGQTACRVKSDGNFDDVKLGPSWITWSCGTHLHL